MFKQLLKKMQNRSFALGVIVLALTSITNAGARGGRIEGSVVDPTGAKISGARVVLRDSTGVIAYEARTDSQGHFSIAEVAGGRYQVTAEARGFSSSRKVIVELRDGATETLNLEVEIAAFSDHLVVTATRTAASTNELGGSVSVVTGEEITRRNYSHLSEPLRLIPGLAVAQTGGRGGVTSVFTRGGESDYNKVLIDGVPVNAPGGLFDFSALTPENFERIEVVRGPGSALFGSDAMTSVVQLVTRRGTTSTPELELSGEGGSFDFHRETARLSGAARWFDYSGSFGFLATDGRFRNSDFINRSASASLGFRLSEVAELRVSSRWNGNTLGVAGPTAVLFSDPDQRQKHRDISIAAGLDWKLTPGWHQTARFIFSEFDTNSFDPAAQDLTRPDTPLLPPGAFGDDFAFTFRDHEKRAGFQYQSIVALGSSNLITAGVDFEHESGVIASDFSRVSPDRNNLGLYIQGQASLRERLFVTAGVRVERNSGSVPGDLIAALASLGSSAPVGEIGFGVSVNPKIASALLVRRHRGDEAFGATRLRFSFGTGIKEPTLTEAFSPSIFFLGNPALDPERAISFEAGAMQEFFNRRASIDATYFDNRFRDQIAFVSNPVTFGPIVLPDGRLSNFVNVERASARGIEFSAATRPLLRLHISATYTFLRSRLERAANTISSEIGLPLLRRPRHSGTVEASWVTQRYEIGLDGSIVGRRRELDPITGARFDSSRRPLFNDGYTKLNASGSWRFNQFISAFARVENLLNQNYQEVLGFPAYRLNFSAGLRVRIGGDK